MNSRQFQELQEAYLNVYQEIDEATLSATAARAGKDIGEPGKNFSKIAKSAAKRYGSEEAGKRVAGAVLAKMRAHEEVDIYDVILSHLLDEGYASTEEAATAIMANMSEDWRDSVVEAYKDLPVDKMIRKAGVKQFKHGMSVGSGASSNPKTPQQVGKMSAIASMHDAEGAKAKSKMKKN